MRMTEPFTLTLLRESDAEGLLAFEQENRAFFARWVADRGDDYFAHFASRLQALVEENQAGISLLYVVRGADNQIVGRVNITDIHHPDMTELGYRIAEGAQGRGLATGVIKEALSQAKALGVKTVRARTTTHNAGSQRVLERVGFHKVSHPSGELEVAGQVYPVLHYVTSLQPGE